MNKVIGLFVLCVLIAACAGQTEQCKNMHPIVLIPGVMGTVLHASAKIPPGSDIPSSCPHNFKNQLIWIDIHEVINYKCLRYYFQSNYIPEKKEWQDIEGMETLVPKWGSTYAVSVLAPGALTASLVPYYRKMIEKLEDLGYKDGENLVGGGYDWKNMPKQEWLDKLKDLIEGMVKKAGQKAVIVGHSMGCPFSYYFLRKMGDDWVKKYIHMYAPMAPAWMGATKALDVMLEGLDRDLPVAGKYFAPMMRHVPSLWFLLPWKDAFKGDILAMSPHKNYTFDQLETLLNDGNASFVEGKLKATQGMFAEFNNYEKPPPVPIRAFIGHGKNTVTSLVFKDDIKPHAPDGSWESCTRIYGDGDGTVPIKSLVYVTDKWKTKGADLKVFMYNKMGHLPLIKDSYVIKDLIREICD